MKKLLVIYAAALVLSACTKKTEEAPAETPSAAEAPADAGTDAGNASSESSAQ